uniref:Calcineurin-like phosphoesterase domain-containing protein n=1 Tax=Bionectria ochroleuca TaxID=29856 RepID=A0A8H7NNF5_BIOOC
MGPADAARPSSELPTHLHHYPALLPRHLPPRPARQSPRDKEPIRVVSISDTHDQTVSIPPGDILIHAGDLTDAGTAYDIQLQLDWLKKQPHPVKIVIAGNHDSYFDPRSRKQEDIDQASKLDLDGITYLENSSTVVEIKDRKLNIFGAPDIPKCGPSSFAFQYPPDESKWMSKVPPTPTS